MFWLVAFGMIAISLWVIARPLLRTTADAQPAAEQDLQVYKDQLSEVERDLARGVLSAAEAEGARLEVSRRILAADKRLQTSRGSGQSRSTVNKLVTGLMALALVGGSLALYLSIGNPGMPDRPLQQRLAEAQAQRDARPDQAQAEAMAPPVPEAPKGAVPQDYLELVEKLRSALVERPNDIEGHRLLALHEARLGNYVAARKAQQVVVDLQAGAATGEEHTALAEYMIFAANGYVSPDAEDALVKALQLAPTNPRARYFSGLALAQNGRPDVAYRMWIGLLEEGPEDAPWIGPIRSQIASVAQAAGIDITDSDLPGPSAEQVEDAQDMTPEDRQDMIRGMVAGLAERLATEGGTPQEWTRLIRAYGVLGELDKAALIWTEARQTFASDAAAMKLLREAAGELGID
jgi:cytochrome c-type biogenesis protein CcmH